MRVGLVGDRTTKTSDSFTMSAVNLEPVKLSSYLLGSGTPTEAPSVTSTSTPEEDNEWALGPKGFKAEKPASEGQGDVLVSEEMYCMHFDHQSETASAVSNSLLFRNVDFPSRSTVFKTRRLPVSYRTRGRLMAAPFASRPIAVT